MPESGFHLSVPLVVALVVGAASPAAATPRGAGEAAASCRIASWYKIDSFRRRNFYIPGTRYIDGPGGAMRVWVMRAYTVKSEFEIEDWREWERRRLFHARGGPKDVSTEVTREAIGELVTERSAGRSAGAAEEVTREVTRDRPAGDDAGEARPADTPADPGTDPPTDSGTGTRTDTRRGAENREEERELLAAMREMVSPLISDDHTVEAGHEYVRKISDGKYGYLRYRVFGYRVGFSKWWKGDDCRVHRAASGVAGVPARVEGWVYRERKRPNPKWLRGR